MTKPRTLRVGIIVVILIFLFSLAGSAISHLLWPSGRFVNEPLHATAEAVGAVAALSLGVIILVLRNYSEDYVQYLWIASAFISMGTLDIFHALAFPGITFVWFRSTATLVGGFFFALTFVPEQIARSRLARPIPKLVFTLAVLFGILSLIFHDALPVMEQAGSFTKTAKAINTFGGILFMIAATRFFIRFSSSKLADELIFSNLCVLLGMAGFLFIYSSLWTADWWFWHILRLTAYFIVISYTFIIFQRLEEKLKRNVMALNSEIIDRKLAEENLIKSAAEINDLYNNAPCGYQSLDKDGILVHINDTELSWLGYSREEIIGKKKFPDIITEKSRKIFQESFPLLKERGWLQDIEVDMIRKNGSVMNVLLSATALADETGNFLMSRSTLFDITARKRAEEALRGSERFLETIIENAPVCIKLLAADGRVMRMNRAGLKMIDADSLDQIKGKNIYQIVSYEYREAFKNLTEEVFAGRSGTLEFEMVGLKGEHRWLDTHAVPLYDDKKEIIALLGITLDTSERKRAEEAVIESKERTSAISEGSMDAIVMVDEGGIVSYFNASAEKMFGYRQSEVTGRSLHELIVSEEAQGKYYQALPEYQKTGQCRIVGKSIEVNATRKDGTRFPAEISVVSMQIKGKWHAAGTVRDITERRRAEEERKRLEQQLMQSQKMEAIGQLAGGIAHDFNNILTAIISYANLVQMTVPADDPSKAYVDNVLALSNRAATLTQGLLAFSRKQILDQRPVDMNEIIRKVEKFLSRIIGEDIIFRTNLVDGPLTVFADAGQMEQVLMNLAANARDAMPLGGILTVSTLSTVLDEEFVKMHGYGKPGGYVIVSVSDTGTGMNEETRQKIFDPFFTTKELGRGTGLGLSIVYGIIKQHNGYVDVYSEIGKGTIVKFYLPLIAAGAGEAAMAPAVVTPSRGAETILLAEDEPEVRNTTKIILERYGYKVIEASDGEEAVRKFAENKDAVQLLLIDVVMPKKNGREAHEEIIKMRRDVRAIFISGYTADIMYEKGLLEKGHVFVSKPVAPTDLLRKIREVLDK